MGKSSTKTQKKGFWNFIDDIEGDKVVWIIMLLLVIISILAIFSSTPLLLEGNQNRMDIISDHIVIAVLGLGLTFCLYKIPKLGLFKFFSKFGLNDRHLNKLSAELF